MKIKLGKILRKVGAVAAVVAQIVDLIAPKKKEPPVPRPGDPPTRKGGNP